jgi:hypothetical protein
VAGPRTPAASEGPVTRAKRNGNTCGRKSVQSRGKGDLPGPTVTHSCPSMRVWTQGSRLDAGILPVPGSSPASLSDRSLGRRQRRQMPGSAPRGAPGFRPGVLRCHRAQLSSGRLFDARARWRAVSHSGGVFRSYLEATDNDGRNTPQDEQGERRGRGRGDRPTPSAVDGHLGLEPPRPPTDRQPRTTETTDRTVTGAVVRERRNALDGPCGTWNPFTSLSGPATSSRRPGASSTRSGPGAWSETSVRV